MTTSLLDIDLLPGKKYFRIGEVSTLLGVDTHVLRYWEKEFKIVKPYRGKSKQRLYRRQDVATLLHIKKLLHLEGYTISGARKLLANKSIKAGIGSIGNGSQAIRHNIFGGNCSNNLFVKLLISLW